MDAKRENDMLYTTAEIMKATGVGRGIITGRATRLCIPRTGQGYTEDQVLRILTMDVQKHRKSESIVTELREIINRRLKADDIPMAIIKVSGEWMLTKVNAEILYETNKKESAKRK